MIRKHSMIGLLVVGLVACASGAETGRLEEPVTVKFDNPLNLIVIEAKIDGQGPFRFFLDSGASGTVIDTGLAERIGLDLVSEQTRRSTAAGSEVTYSQIRGGIDVELAPGFEVYVKHAIAAPFTDVSRVMVGEHFDGVLGSAFFFQYVIEADYAKREVVFHDSSRYRYDGDGAVLDLEFPARMPRMPLIRATLVNGENRLEDFQILVDSGGQTMGTASVETRRQWDDLITPANRIVEVMGATGLSNEAEGTTHEAFATQMDRLILGPFEFERPLVSYSAGGPSFAVMGATLLHRFTVIFDYERKRLILEPNAEIDKPLLAESSGVMFVNSRDVDGAFEVLFVSDGTPGQEAGLSRGDMILAVDDVPASEIGLNEARMMFCEKATYRLEVQRDGRTRETVLETRALYGD